MTIVKYNSNKVSNAVARIFSPVKGIKTASLLRSKTGDREWNWETINETLFAAGWSPKHLAKLSSNLKNI